MIKKKADGPADGPRMIDPDAQLHSSWERQFAGLSPKDRAKKLVEVVSKIPARKARVHQAEPAEPKDDLGA